MAAFKNIHQYAAAAQQQLPKEAFDYLSGGSDDLRTLHRNAEAFRYFQIRPRRLVDVRQIDCSINLFGQSWKSPIILAPVGTQGLFHPDGELATARAADKTGHLMIASTVSSHSYTDIAAASSHKPWLQLYPTSNRETTKMLLQLAEQNGCTTLALTVDVPVAGNREAHLDTLNKSMNQPGYLGNFTNHTADFDAGLDWNFIHWLRQHSSMRILLKGIMTAEDALLALDHEVDGLIVSNHGGRQLESDLSTIECLEEIVQAVGSQLPILLDGGIRRGTDIFKALALGATAVCIGRAFIYGLVAGGQKGVEEVLELLDAELYRNMQLAGTTSIKGITRKHVQISKFR